MRDNRAAVVSVQDRVNSLARVSYTIYQPKSGENSGKQTCHALNKERRGQKELSTSHTQARMKAEGEEKLKTFARMESNRGGSSLKETGRISASNDTEACGLSVLQTEQALEDTGFFMVHPMQVQTGIAASHIVHVAPPEFFIVQTLQLQGSIFSCTCGRMRIAPQMEQRPLSGPSFLKVQAVQYTTSVADEAVMAPRRPYGWARDAKRGRGESQAWHDAPPPRFTSVHTEQMTPSIRLNSQRIHRIQISGWVIHRAPAESGVTPEKARYSRVDDPTPLACCYCRKLRYQVIHYCNDFKLQYVCVCVAT